MQLKFAIPAAAVIATAGYLWLLGQVGSRPTQHPVATTALADTAPIAQPRGHALLPEPLPGHAAPTPASPVATSSQTAVPLRASAYSADDDATAEPISDSDDEALSPADSHDPVELSLQLQHGNEAQRLDALREAGDAGSPLPMALLLRTLRYDRSERVRAGSLDYLAESGATRRSELLDAIAVAERDPEAAIQARARELRSGLQQLAIAEASANLQQQPAAP